MGHYANEWDDPQINSEESEDGRGHFLWVYTSPRMEQPVFVEQEEFVDPFEGMTRLPPLSPTGR